MAGLTVDLEAAERALRIRALTYRSVTGVATLAERLSGGLHVGSPPDNANYPYGALRVLNLRTPMLDAPIYGVQVEVQLFYRPRAEASALRQATDVLVESLEQWSDADARAAGIYRTEVRDVDILPPFSEAADPEVIASRATFDVELYPLPTT
jgi:hypothetical protein